MPRILVGGKVDGDLMGGLRAAARSAGVDAVMLIHSVSEANDRPNILTLLDLTEDGSTIAFTMSHVAARQELRDLLIVLKLPALSGEAIPF